MEQFKRLRPWIWVALTCNWVIRIALVVGSYWRLGATRFQFACQVAEVMIVMTIPYNYGKMQDVFTIGMVCFFILILSFDGLMNLVIAQAIPVYICFFVKPSIYGEETSREVVVNGISVVCYQVGIILICLLLQKASYYK